MEQLSGKMAEECDPGIRAALERKVKVSVSLARYRRSAPYLLQPRAAAAARRSPSARPPRALKLLRALLTCKTAQILNQVLTNLKFLAPEGLFRLRTPPSKLLSNLKSA